MKTLILLSILALTSCVGISVETCDSLHKALVPINTKLKTGVELTQGDKDFLDVTTRNLGKVLIEAKK